MENKILSVKGLTTPVDAMFIKELEQEIVNQLDKSTVGNDDAKRLAARIAFTKGHMLLVGAPGLGKTRLVLAMGEVVADAKAMVKTFVADLMPSDLIGTRPYNQATGSFDIDPGPLVGTLLTDKDGKIVRGPRGEFYSTINFFAADEINRANQRMQSALLGAMQEKTVTIGKNVIMLPRPFSMYATRNPLENKGTFPLPEAQLDRFAIEVEIEYLSIDGEEYLADHPEIMADDGHLLTKPATDCATLIAAEQFIREGVYLSPIVRNYIVRLVRATRPQCADTFNAKLRAGLGEKSSNLQVAVEWGGSPRAQNAFVTLAKAGAAAEGRDYVLPRDVQALTKIVLGHRIIRTGPAEAQRVNQYKIVEDIVRDVKVNEEDERKFMRPTA